MLGFLLLIIPGLFLLTIWFVAMPARVAEDISVFGAFSRSAALTSGRRWGVFAVLVVSVLIALLLQTVIGFAQIAVVGLTFESTIETLLFSVLSEAAGAIIIVAATGVAYYLLRIEKEGGDANAVADVFA